MTLTREFKAVFVVISRNNCSFCEKAKALLVANDILYEECNIELLHNKWVLDLLRKGDVKTVPQIYDMSGRHVGGYTELEELISNLKE
jgi:glutaredoxin